MTALKPCSKCTKRYSEDAYACPECGLPRVETAPMTKACHACLQPLPEGAHRYSKTTTSTSWHKGTSTTHEHVHVWHVPCPNCADPQPHRRYIDTDSGKTIYWVTALSFAIGLGVGLPHHIYGALSAMGIVFLSILIYNELKK